MLKLSTPSASGSNCQGVTRRSAIKAGTLGAMGLSMADLARLHAAAGTEDTGKSVILLWLDGGPSQFETYDPKPGAPSTIRGPFGAIKTNVPGIEFCEMLPLQAKHADKMAVIRSVHHDNGDHFAAGHWMLSGRFGSTSVNQAAMYPGVGACVSKVLGGRNNLPAYVGLPAAHAIYVYPGYMGGAYLGSAYDPFQVNLTQKYMGANSTVPIKPPPFLASVSGDVERTRGRLGLLGKLDQLDRYVDRSGMMETMDSFQREAVGMIMGGKAREAFDMDLENDKLRDSYGRGPWGHYTLMARRLVESGCRFVSVDMPHWDTHSKIKEGMETRLPHLDLAVSGLLQDLHDRGMQDDVLVVIMGEFGRTPTLNTGQPGIPVPGRDHWGNSMSVILAGGGLKMGLTVGATNDKGEHPVERPLEPADVLATIYHVLGIDPHTSFLDNSGRPIPLVDGNKAIAELI